MKRLATFLLLLLPVVGCGQGEEGADLYATVAPGTAHTCATTDAGHLVCWGFNASGQAGVEADLSSVLRPHFLLTGPLFVGKVVSGPNFSCGLLEGAGALCWGDGSPELRQVASGMAFRDLDVGRFGCGATKAGTVVCWSGPDATVLPVDGLAGVTEVAVGLTRACAVGPELGIRCWTDPGAATTLVSGTTGATYHGLTVGDDHGCVLDSLGVGRCWGANASGQLGIGTFNPAATPTVVLWGDRPSNSDLFTSIDAGSDFTCGVTQSHGGYCWGEGTVYPASVEAIAKWDVLQSGGDHVCGFTRADHALYCWGGNNFGQLGTGDTLFANLARKVVEP